MSLEFDIRWVSTASHVQLRQQPSLLLQRSAFPMSRLWVPQCSPLDPLSGDTEQDRRRWRYTTRGDVVRVPMHAIRTQAGVGGPAPAALWSAGLQVGLAALASLQAMHPQARPQRCVLVLGDQCDLQSDYTYRCYFGLALVEPE